MLKEAKLALGLTTDAYDARLAALLDAGAKDLRSVGVEFTGTVSLTVASNGTVTDESTLDDNLVIEAILTYVMVHFGNPSNYAQLLESYDYQKKKLANTSAYTEWGEADADS